VAKPKSGYEAVYWDLMQTETARNVRENLIRWCREASIDRYWFTVESEPETGLAMTRTHWKILFGPTEQEFADDEYTRFQLSVSRAANSGDAVDTIIKTHYGKDVGTRNCSIDGIKNGVRRTRNDYQRNFYGAYLEHIKEDGSIARAVAEAQNRIVGKMIAVSQTTEFARRRTEALIAAAREEVRSVMLKFREVPDSVLAEALREAAVEGIMDW